MGVKMVSDMDTTMMEIERIDRAGDRLKITGLMMGNFPAEIYMEPGDLLAIAKLHFRPSPLGFVIGLPYFWLRSYWRKNENRNVPARLKGLLLVIAGTAALLAAAAALAVGFWTVARALLS